MEYKKEISKDILQLNNIAEIWSKYSKNLGKHKHLVNKTYSLIRRLYIRLVLNFEKTDESLKSLIILKYFANLKSGMELNMLKLLIFYYKKNLPNNGEDEYEVYNSGARDLEWMDSLPEKYQLKK